MALLYNLELGFYISSIFMIIFWEIRRKDFAVMFSHHIATTLLVGASLHFQCVLRRARQSSHRGGSAWPHACSSIARHQAVAVVSLLMPLRWHLCCRCRRPPANDRCTRVGVLIMLLHDANDIFMEGAKLAKYGQRETAAVACFGTFAVTWLLTRLLFFPLVVIRSVVMESRTYVPLGNTIWAVFSGLLCTLLALHCYWYALILRVAYTQLTMGEADDVREMDDD
jgi:hypothetical protein